MIRGVDLRRAFLRTLVYLFNAEIWFPVTAIMFLGGVVVGAWQLVAVHGLPGMAALLSMSGLAVLVVGVWWYMLHQLGRAGASRGF